MGFETIPAKDIDRYVGQPGVFIIDLREREEFRSQHIRGAYNIPYEELDRYKGSFGSHTLILYCERGGTSLMAAKHLGDEGYHVKTVVGGILAYRGRYLETE